MLKIAWDVDDVLNNLTQNWLYNYCNIKNIKINYENITENPPCSILNIELDEYLKTLDDFPLKKIIKNVTKQQDFELV